MRIVAVGLGLMLSSPGVFGQTLPPSGDAHVTGGNSADRNFGGASFLNVSAGHNESNTSWAYLKFDTTGVSGLIREARLRLFAAVNGTSSGGSASSVQTSLYAAPPTWGETTLTWNNKPAMGPQLGSFAVGTGAFYEFEVTEYVRAQRANGQVGFGVRLPAVSNDAIVISSREPTPTAFFYHPAQLALIVNSAPAVSLTSPANGAVFNGQASITLSASAADADGLVTQVEFFANGASIGSDTTAPFSIEWVNPSPGTHNVTAIATDNDGEKTTSAAVTLRVNIAPTVSITSPANGATFTAPANITIAATAADPDGTIASVAFYFDTTLIATRTTPPYTFTWTGVPQGSYALTAVATDDVGASTTSAAVPITVRAAVAQLYYIHVDHLNTPRLVADAAGTTVWRWDQQEPFGVNVPDENPSEIGAFEFPMRFPGQYSDRETNLSYNYFRDYDSGTGRYLQSDPIRLDGGLNTYAYAFDPITQIDPLGLLGRGPGGNSKSGPSARDPNKMRGCGPEGTVLDAVISNNPLGFPFQSCCDAHDRCYENCKGPSKFDCDMTGCGCLTGQCSRYVGFVQSVCNRLAQEYCHQLTMSDESVDQYRKARERCKKRCNPNE